MSNSMAINDSSKFAGQQKMTFSQTCNLLSQYVKEKRALGISGNLDAAARGGATMNLFPVKQQAEDSNGSVGRTINLFPQSSGFNSSGNKRASPEPTGAQMTIFYGGQVVVFNDLPADKAKEVLDLASSIESTLKKRKVDTPASPVSVPVPVPSQAASIKPVSNPTPTPAATTSANRGSLVMPATAAAVPRNSMPSVTDLPIARKASLHRFLEKRKDRLVGKAPITGNDASEGAAKPAEGMGWLGLNSLPIFHQQQLAANLVGFQL